MKSKIVNVRAIQIIDSRGNPTVEAKVTLESGAVGIASVPSGASTGIHEAHELRDGDKSRYNGKGVLRAVKNVNEVIRPALVGMSAENQGEIDRVMLTLDGSENKSNLGANAILAVSLATAKAAAASLGMPLYRYLGGNGKPKLPTPMFNVLNGGAHASNNIDIQEFMIVPKNMLFSDAMRAGCEIYQALKQILKDKGMSTAVGDEGGYAPDLSSDEEAIELLCLAIEKSGYKGKVGIALDVASSEWYEDGVYRLPKRKKSLTGDELIEYYTALCDKYPIVSIEDGLNEDDFDGWRKMTEALGKRIMLVGDDLFVTNEKRLKMGIDGSFANSILIKPNQIGSLTETLNVIGLAKSAGYDFILSHRSGDTPDTSIADIAVATGAGYIKSGAPCRGERIAKYNRLLEIESEI